MPAIKGGKFVILGGASQIGSHIAERLLADEVGAVVLVDNLWLGTTETMEPLLADPRCTFVRGDVLRLNELYDALAGADGVFAVAGIMASTISENPYQSIDVNVRGFQNALEASRYQGVKKVIFSSSLGVYGVLVDDPTDESSPCRWQLAPPATTLYSSAKIMCEALARLYKERYGIDYVALRYSAVYGERQHGRAVVGGHIAQTCERLRNGEPAFIDGDGLQVQDYVYVGDVARANIMAMASDVTDDAVNVCSGVDTSQARIVELATELTGSSLKPEYRPFKVLRLPPAKKLNLSRDKAKRLLGWEPQVTIEEGVSRVLRWVDRGRSSPK